jgi:ABC-type lipoprotein release transport system permease subunit
VTAFGVTRVMKNMLFGLSSTDPLTFVTISLLLVAVALVASYLPALRATRVDPVVALRTE